MTKAELISSVARKSSVTKKVAESVLKSFTETIHESVKRNGHIRISDLGTFLVVEKKARTGVHPRTKAKIQIPATKSTRFRPAKALRDSAMSVELEESADAVRDEVQRLWSEGDAVSAFHRAMKSYLKAQRRFGRNARRTARFMLIVADASRHREKHYLAGQWYRKALPILEKAFGPSHPDVVHCKTALSDLERDHGL
jgi:nucleoid DNA-binding protein